jgi:streptogramin lyase
VSPVIPSVAPSTAPAPTAGPPLPAGWSHVADPPREDGDGVVVEFGGLLVIANAGHGEIAFLDPAAGDGGQIVARRTVGAPSRGLPMARTGALWWIGVGGSFELVLFDPAGRSVVRRIPIGAEAYNLAAFGDVVYVSDFENGRLLRVDTSTDEVTASVPLVQAAGVAVLPDGSVLVASRPGSLLEVDPVTLETLEETTIQGDVMTLIPDGDRVIITRNNADRLSTIDPDNLAAGEDLPETRISAFTMTDEEAWGIDWMSGEVLRLNRDSLAVVERVPPISDGQDGIALAAGDLWVEGTTADGPVVHRIRPPTP